MVLDTKLFIKRIQQYPEIFDTAHPGFKQVDDKNGAWEKIAVEFKVDCEHKSRQPSGARLMFRKFIFSKFGSQEVPNAERALHSRASQELP